MKIKHAVMIGMLGRIADRFHEYQPAMDLRQRLQMTRQVSGVDGIEVVYPSEFTNLNDTNKILRDSGFPISAVNLNLKTDKCWEGGSFTSPNTDIRSRALGELKSAMDLAAELGTKMVTFCPLIDGHNYSFEVDYLKQWNWLKEGIAEGSRYRNDIRISLEYKLNESRNFNILSDMGRTLYICKQVGLPNVGITMDVGHALIAKETPAEAACLAAQEKRLFYIHFNDNGREWDWDMLPGAVNLWDLIEMVYYLERINWEGWLSYDVIPRGSDPVETMTAAISIVNSAIDLTHKLGLEQLQGFIQEGNPPRTFEQLWRSLL
jgi:xylose isomerase